MILLSIELWLALAHLEMPEKSKAVLNKAHKAVPMSYEIWIAAGHLLEQEDYAADLLEEKHTKEHVDKMLAMAVHVLCAHSMLLTCKQWVKEAEQCEAEGALHTCKVIVSATVVMDVKEEDHLTIWLGNAEAAEVHIHVGTMHAVFAYTLHVFPDLAGGC